tara:strand:- start:334 stop:2106 length:1773 start_codon:yes stop_codon:yes gene_type:complete
MKILKLLNKKKFSIFFIIFLFFTKVIAEEKPVDIWNLDKEKTENNSSIENTNSNKEEKEYSSEQNLFNLQKQNQIDEITLDNKLESKELEIIGLYDPEDNGLTINMWANSDGDQLKNIFSKLMNMNLSVDAAEIINISMLTNAYYPNKNITDDEFLKFKSTWLIKNSNLELIEDYLIKNQAIDIHPKLTRYLVDKYLSESNIDKACEIFLRNLKTIDDEYLSKFNIYCLINAEKINEAQLILDLKKELGFKNEYFENKINLLLGYSKEINDQISEKSILDFHLAHRTNPDFFFEPKENTNKIIWKYLASANLLYDVQKIEITELDKITTIEKATHNKNYPEEDLFELYTRFQFNINQLINAKTSYKSLSKIEARALIYQKILLESEFIERLKLLKILKTLFKEDDIGEAFDVELKKFLNEIDPASVPDTLTSFYYTNIEINKESNQKIKYNNDILHQSKFINYFNGDYSKSKIEKEINNFLKKIKKNKKYIISRKDIIFLESLKSDGINVEKKYDDLYKTSPSEIPTDIQVMINNDEKGTALLRIAEVIGQDSLDRIDEDTLYFIISTLNQLNVGLLRNKILLKVLPLKV